MPVKSSKMINVFRRWSLIQLEQHNYDSYFPYRKHMVGKTDAVKFEAFINMMKEDYYYREDEAYGFKYTVKICKLLDIDYLEFVDHLEYHDPYLVKDIKNLFDYLFI